MGQGQATRTYQRKKQEKVIKGAKKKNQTNKQRRSQRVVKEIFTKQLKKQTNKTPFLHLVACHKPNLPKVTTSFLLP
jgi:hypothetical protein